MKGHKVITEMENIVKSKQHVFKPAQEYNNPLVTWALMVIFKEMKYIFLISILIFFFRKLFSNKM